jgi:hypothetical protein
MDLRLFWGVVKRYKRLAIGGTLVAALLAILAYGTPSLSGGLPTIVPHTPPVYQSQAQLLIAQGNGIYSRADPQSLSAGAPNFLSSLSPVYAGLANGSAVQRAVRASHIPGTLSATEGVDPNTGDYTPFLNLTTSAPTPQDAERLSRIAINAFQSYLEEMQGGSSVPASSRVLLQVVKSGNPATLAAGKKVALLLLVFIVILTALVALMFSLENKDPQTAAKLGRLLPSPVVAGLNGDAAVAATSEFGSPLAARGNELSTQSGESPSHSGTFERLYRPGLADRLKRP